MRDAADVTYNSNEREPFDKFWNNPLKENPFCYNNATCTSK